MYRPKTVPVKVLLVDDRKENLVALAALLRRDGVELLQAQSGDEALELLLVHEVALALLDVEMPEMDGFALAELMRGAERSKHVPIIFVTANATESHRIFDGYDAGAVDFLIKPIDPRILRHKANTFLELYRKQRELAETLRLNETFAAAVGHDLRSPLQAIIAGVNLISEITQEPLVKKGSERIRSSAQRMARMIDDLFDVARTRLSDGLTLARTPGDACALTRRAVGELESAFPGRVVRVRHAESERVEWDVHRMERVVSNLVGNALRHGVEGAPVDVTIEGDESSVEIAVHNEGYIPEHVIPSLFDPFRTRERSAKQEGLGLGLYIVQQVVAAHQGHVRVTSTETAGTTFSVRLPRRPR